MKQKKNIPGSIVKKHCYSCKITNCVLHLRAFSLGVRADWKTKKIGLLRFQNGMNFTVR